MQKKKIKPKFSPFLMVYDSSVIVSRETFSSGICGTGKRGDIHELSRGSRARLAFFAAETTIPLQTFITLTYPKEYKNDGKSVKSDLNRYLTWLRYYFGKIDYIWFMEFQRRGAPHFHILLSKKLSDSVKKKLSVRWCDQIAKDTETYKKMLHVHWYNRRAVEDVRSKDGAKRYILKYATKTYQKTVPKDYRNVGRFWGISKGIRDSVMNKNYGIVKLGDNENMIEFLETHFGAKFSEAKYIPKIVWKRQ